jgi:hypothetical protein
MSDIQQKRLHVILPPKELKLVDEFRVTHRMRTRAAAIRELLRRGLVTNMTRKNQEKIRELFSVSSVWSR